MWYWVRGFCFLLASLSIERRLRRGGVELVSISLAIFGHGMFRSCAEWLVAEGPSGNFCLIAVFCPFLLLLSLF